LRKQVSHAAQGRKGGEAESGKGSRQAGTNFIIIIQVTPLVQDWEGKHHALEKAGQPCSTRKGGRWGSGLPGSQSRQGSRGLALMVVLTPGKDTTGPKRSFIVVDERINVGAVSGPPLVKATPQQ